MEKSLEAAIEHLKRKLRVNYPIGTKDKGGRWYPTNEYPCCKSIRSPSRSWPFTYLSHCCSAEHVAQEFGVEVQALKEHLKKKNLPLLLTLDDPCITNYIAGKFKEV